MILQDALCDLKDLLLDTGYFFKFYEYTEVVPLNGTDRAVYFTTGGSFTDVHDFDRNGSGYIRKRGQVQTEVLSDSYQPVACVTVDPVMLLRYPLRAVFAVPKSKLANDNYSDETLALNLMGLLNRGYTPPSGITRLTGTVTGYETSRIKVWQEEVQSLSQGVQKRVMNLDLSYIYMDFTLAFTVKQSCLLENECYGVTLTPTPDPDPDTSSCMINGLHITTGPYLLTPATITTVLIMDPTHTVTLPDPTDFQEGVTYLFKDGTLAAGTNNLQILPAAGKNFEGLAADDPLLMVDDGQTVAIFSDLLNTYWFDNS